MIFYHRLHIKNLSKRGLIMQIIEQFKRLKYTGATHHIPILIILALVVIIILVLQLYREHQITMTLAFVISASCFSVCVWFSETIFTKLKSFYFFFQGMIIIIAVFMIPPFSIITLTSFGSILVVQSFYFYNQIRQFLAFLISYISFGTLLLYVLLDWQKFTFYLFIFVMSLVIVFLIFFIFSSKELENIALQESNEKIEWLTRQNERQRMARDLHDSLIQKLIALNLKMDVIDVHMQKGQHDKASAIIKTAKQQVGESIVEARKVVEDLRLQTDDLSLREKFFEDIIPLKYTYSIQIDSHIHYRKEPFPLLSDNIIAIVKEAVTNVQKHAKADCITIHFSQIENGYCLTIADNGVGIDVQQALHAENHFGLVGMQERVQLFDGTFQIQNEQGTKISITFPIERL